MCVCVCVCVRAHLDGKNTENKFQVKKIINNNDPTMRKTG